MISYKACNFNEVEKNFNDRTAYVDSEDQIVNFNDLLKWTLGMLLEDLQKKGYVIPSRDISDYERIFGKKKNSLLRTAYMSGIEDILIGKFDYCTCRHERVVKDDLVNWVLSDLLDDMNNHGEFYKDWNEYDNDPQPHNFSKDYFDAMTDGSMGDYEDFEGNSDFIDDWSGR